MENYIVSARKYRPETFQTVIGQPSITTTLKNAIRSKQLAHAYLFCGPRGIGKTTCARILAKTINCQDLSPDTEACNKCESCLSFNSSRSFNIHELDAASNNSVEDIRSLIEQVRIPPQVGRYSIYIIDEVHMLSSQAFNAFLKTLEEPPAHAIFILATTEKHKVLPTILSRCQIYDFHRIKIEDIVTHLESIAASENIEAESEGLNIIAQKADGAMRDALSIFDQIASFSGGKITYQNVIANLNVLDYDYYFRLTAAFLTGNIPASLLIFNEVLERGFDGHNFVNGLSRHFRDLLVCRDEVTLKLLQVGASIREKYREQSKSSPPEFLLRALEITNQCDISFRSSKNQRLHVELCLVRICGLMTGEKKKSDAEAKGLKRKEPPHEASAGNRESPKHHSHKTVSGRETSQAADLKGKNENVPPPVSTHSTIADSGKSSDNKGVERSATSLPNREQAETGETVPVGPAVLIKGQEQQVKGQEQQVNKDKAKKNYEAVEENANGTISIKDVLRGTTPPAAGGQVREEMQEDDLPETGKDDDELLLNEEGDDLTVKDLSEQWKKFANQIRNRHPRLYNTLLANKPIITGSAGIEFEVSNPLQKEAMNRIKPELLKHLKRELNKNIELVVKVNEGAVESRLYLPEDKFGHMVKKNPDLALLRQKLNLDFD